MIDGPPFTTQREKTGSMGRSAAVTSTGTFGTSPVDARKRLVKAGAP